MCHLKDLRRSLYLYYNTKNVRLSIKILNLKQIGRKVYIYYIGNCIYNRKHKSVDFYNTQICIVRTYKLLKNTYVKNVTFDNI